MIIEMIRKEGFFHCLREGSLFVVDRLIVKILDTFGLWPEEVKNYE